MLTGAAGVQQQQQQQQQQQLQQHSSNSSMLIYEVATCSDMDAVIIAWQLVASQAQLHHEWKESRASLLFSMLNRSCSTAAASGEHGCG